MQTSESTGCKQTFPVLGTWLKFFISIIDTNSKRKSFLVLAYLITFIRSKLLTVCAATKTGATKLPKVHIKRQPKLPI